MFRIEDRSLKDTLGALLSSSVTGVVEKSDEAFAAIKSFQSSFKQISRSPAMIQSMLQLEFNFVGMVDASEMTSKKQMQEALATDWYDSTFVVVDYSNVETWLNKCIAESEKGKTVVALVPSRTSSHWFHDLILEQAKEVRFVKGRVTMTGKSTPGSTPDAIVVYHSVPNKRRRKDAEPAAVVIRCSTDFENTSFEAGFSNQPNP